MEPRVSASWGRIARALPTLGLGDPQLAAGATEADIAAFESAVSVQLPEQVRELFRGHDGQTSAKAGLAGGYHFVSLREAQKLMEDWAATRAKLGDGIKDLDRACSSSPSKAIQRKYSTAGWVPLLRDNEGNAIGVDLQPGSAGSAGQIINFGRDEDDKFVLFPSAAALLEWLANELEHGRIVYDAQDEVVRHAEGRLVAAIVKAAG
jgi:cell wall assembly regulator SMI1